MGAPLPKLCNPSAGYSLENRLELPAVEVIACSLVVRDAGRAKFASCTAVAVTLLSLLAATAGAATAQQLHPSPPQRGAPEVTASGFAAATLPSIESIDAQTDITVFLQSGVPDALRLAALRRSGTSRGCRRTTGISTTPTASRVLENSAPRSVSKEWWRKFLVRLRAWRSPLRRPCERNSSSCLWKKERAVNREKSHGQHAFRWRPPA
jgi:Protein of unknown function (DUF3306)